MGRSLALLTQGRIDASLHQHPFGLPFLLSMIGWGVLPERLLLRLQREGCLVFKILHRCACPVTTPGKRGWPSDAVDVGRID
jgi:hypothetical protein